MSQNSHFSDQELDGLFQEAAAQGKAPAFDDAYWAEMEAMLPAAKKRRGVAFWFTIGAIPIVLGIIGLSVFGWNRNERSLVQVQSDVQPADKKATAQLEPDMSDNKSIESSEQADVETGMANPATESRIEKPARRTPRSTPIAEPKLAASFPVVIDAQNIVGSGDQISASSADNTFNRLYRKGFLFTYPVTLNDVAREAKIGRSWPIYLDFAVGYGQSYRQMDFENNWMSQFKLGAGIYSEIGNMQLSAGVDLRAEVPGNVSRVTSDATYSSVTNFRGIYSVDFPLYAGGSWGRSSFGGMMIPGIQIGYSGTKLQYQNTALVSRDEVAGTIPDSKSLTMEFGARYGYALTEHVQFAASMNVDVLRPFQSDAYSGETRNFPVSFFLGLRRTF